MLDFIPAIALAGIAILVGFVGLVWSADRFVAGAASIAEVFGIAPVIIGLTIVSFGTSAPEVMVSLTAALGGAGELAIGNAIGSNIANIGLVLGITLLISRIPVVSNLLRHEGSVLLFLSALAGYFLFDRQLSVFEGWVLLALLPPSIWYLTVTKQRDHTPEELVEEDIEHYPPALAILWFIIGLITLIISSKILVWGAETTAIHFNVSPLVIGLSIIAIGTSLPELAASIMSALKGHHDIAVGNIVGSNIFNLLAVMSIPGIFASPPLDDAVFTRDFTAMMGLTLLLFASMIVALARDGQLARLGRPAGALMLCAYIAYIYVLAQAQFTN